jgi:hypothetical protein
LNRYVAFQDVVNGDASIDVRLRDAIDRQWLAGSASAAPATAARASAKTAKTAGRLGEGAYSNEPGRRVGAEGQVSRAGDHDALREPIGRQAVSSSQLASPCRLPNGDANVNEIGVAQYWRGTAARSRNDARRVTSNEMTTDRIGEDAIR